MRISDWSSDVCSADLVTESGGHIHLILPDPVERAACFRALAAGGERVVRSFASADAWIEADGDDLCAILLFRWRPPGRTDGAALLERIAGHPAKIGRASCRERVGQYV